MAYGTASDLRDVLVPRGDPLSNTAASMDDIQLEEAIVDAMGLVDGYTGTAFDDQDVPRLVKTLTLHIAAYFATMTYRKNVELSQRDPIVLRYQNALQILAAIQQGIISIEPYVEDQPGVSPSDSFAQNPYTGNLFDLQTFGLGPVGRCSGG